MVLETDYLVIGAGATGLAFADALHAIDETARITLVDRRDGPGGHWRDAYPFVRLHQPAAFYGVNSTPLGDERLETTGWNAGFYALSSGREVISYFERVLHEGLMASGRVRFFGQSEVADGEIRHLLSGETLPFDAGCIVDATRIGTEIPATRPPAYAVAEGTPVIPPNELPRRAAGAPGGHVTVIGAGKTAMDACVWLLENGQPGSRIRWVRPRDAWVTNRGGIQPTGAFFSATVGGYADELEALAAAASLGEYAEALEAAGRWFRIDRDVRPEMMHGATLSGAEVVLLREIADVVRLGRVTALAPGRMTLDGGEIAGDSLYVDCSASGLGRRPPLPVFEEGRINLEMIRIFQPAFSAALIARIAALGLERETANALARPIPPIDDVAGWVAAQPIGMANQMAWGRIGELRDWIRASRLDGFGRPRREFPDGPEKDEVAARIRAAAPAAMENARRLVASG